MKILKSCISGRVALPALPRIRAQQEPHPQSEGSRRARKTAAAAATGESRFEPFVDMACCVSTPDSKALTFLQESAQLLSQPRAISSTTTAGRPPWQAGGPPLRPKTSHPAAAPRSGSLPGAAALASFAPLDALSLISLHCSSLELEPAAGIAPAEAPEGRPPAARAKDGGDLLRRAPGGKPREAPAPLPPEMGTPRHKAEPPAKGRGRRVSRKQPRPRRSCESRDPAFQGVTFQMQLRLCHSSAAGCRLLVRHRYSSGKPRKRSRIPLAKEDDRPGTSEEEDGCLSTHTNPSYIPPSQGHPGEFACENNHCIQERWKCGSGNDYLGNSGEMPELCRAYFFEKHHGAVL
ncbi:hypothetical protein JRQ81_003388 [Phrynocephalus forsythii]|uniref:Uncharacterized protein n=1 Tax=Phrynocephalus forsythii TaxID=171643 RepID=A0A9Q0XKE3_9SAUR|nr:hypothetical protein JRQ81_003388 [Phrynocephalus forsythii]